MKYFRKIVNALKKWFSKKEEPLSESHEKLLDSLLDIQTTEDPLAFKPMTFKTKAPTN